MNALNQKIKDCEKNKKELETLAGDALPEDIIRYLDLLGYFEMPAAAKHHGAYVGGLYDHSKAVAEELINLTDKLELKWKRPESPIIIGFLHDLCKVYQYNINMDEKAEEGYTISYNRDNIVPGHGEASIYLIMEMEQRYPQFKLTAEEKACIRFHMGAYVDQNEWKTLNTAIKKYPNIIYTHLADMIASQIRNI